jgi:hypothetical protein
MQSVHEGGNDVSSMHRQFLSKEIFLLLISVRSWVNSRATLRPEWLWQLKIPMTPSKIEPAPFRIVAQYVNQLCHRLPLTMISEWVFVTCYPSCKAHAPYYIAICGLSSCTIFLHFICTNFSFSTDHQVALYAVIQSASVQQPIGVSPLFSVSHSIIAVVATSVSLLLATVQLK